MDELQISGRRFISARRIAKENGYTSDYIGQLIRGGKIVGQKVGRAWYVDALSFDRYLGSESIEPKEETTVDTLTVEMPVQNIASSEIALEVAQAAAETDVIEETAPKAQEEELAPSEVINDESDSEEVLAEIITPVIARESSKETETTLDASTVEESAEEHERTVSVRVAAAKHDEEKEQQDDEPASSGLRYYADDTPVLPQLEERVEQSSTITKESAEDALAAFASASKKSSSRAYVAGLVIAGIAAFTLSAVLSNAVSLNLSATENAAATSYSVGW